MVTQPIHQTLTLLNIQPKKITLELKVVFPHKYPKTNYTTVQPLVSYLLIRCDIAKKIWSKQDTALCHDVTTSNLIWRSQNIIFHHLSSFQCVIIYALLPNTVKQLLALLVVWQWYRGLVIICIEKLRVLFQGSSSIYIYR